MIDKLEPIHELSEVPQEVEVIPRDPSKVLKIGSTLLAIEKMKITTFLRENRDVFAWKYEDIPKIDKEVIQHRHKLI